MAAPTLTLDLEKLLDEGAAQGLSDKDLEDLVKDYNNGALAAPPATDPPAKPAWDQPVKDFLGERAKLNINPQTLGDNLRNAAVPIENVGKKIAGAAYNTVMHPIDTAKGVAGLVGGAVDKVLPDSYTDPTTGEDVQILKNPEDAAALEELLSNYGLGKGQGGITDRLGVLATSFAEGKDPISDVIAAKAGMKVAGKGLKVAGKVKAAAGEAGVDLSRNLLAGATKYGYPARKAPEKLQNALTLQMQAKFTPTESGFQKHQEFVQDTGKQIGERYDRAQENGKRIAFVKTVNEVGRSLASDIRKSHAVDAAPALEWLDAQLKALKSDPRIKGVDGSVGVGDIHRWRTDMMRKTDYRMGADRLSPGAEKAAMLLNKQLAWKLGEALDSRIPGLKELNGRYSAALDLEPILARAAKREMGSVGSAEMAIGIIAGHGFGGLAAPAIGAAARVPSLRANVAYGINRMSGGRGLQEVPPIEPRTPGMPQLERGPLQGYAPGELDNMNLPNVNFGPDKAPPTPVYYGPKALLGSGPTVEVGPGGVARRIGDTTVTGEYGGARSLRESVSNSTMGPRTTLTPDSVPTGRGATPTEPTFPAGRVDRTLAFGPSSPAEMLRTPPEVDAVRRLFTKDPAKRPTENFYDIGDSHKTLVERSGPVVRQTTEQFYDSIRNGPQR